MDSVIRNGDLIHFKSWTEMYLHLVENADVDLNSEGLFNFKEKSETKSVITRAYNFSYIKLNMINELVPILKEFTITNRQRIYREKFLLIEALHPEVSDGKGLVGITETLLKLV
jgi:hypothetical protein